MRSSIILFFCGLFCTAGMPQALSTGNATNGVAIEEETKATKPGKMYYGVASYYADKFNGRKTANGQTYTHTKLTAACNVLPLGTWVRVTNVKNKRRVVVQINDRLHPKNKRIVDLSVAAAKQLGYIKAGLAQVQVQVLSAKTMKSDERQAHK